MEILPFWTVALYGMRTYVTAIYGYLFIFVFVFILFSPPLRAFQHSKTFPGTSEALPVTSVARVILLKQLMGHRELLTT